MTEPNLPIINLTLCNRCSQCAMQCPEHALVMTDRGPEYADPITCTYCLDCEALCPTGAIRAPLRVTWSAQQ